ncbi:MAG: hypothetical protein ACRYFK_11705 [Janthinobacterium lividum]
MPAPSLAQTLLPERYRRVSLLLFFASLLALGLGVLRDFSMPGDEEIQRMTGEVSLLYVFQKLPPGLQQRLLPPHAAALLAQKGTSVQLRNWRDRDYGVAFELPAEALEHLLRLRDLRSIFLLRHLLNFLVCYGGFLAFYTLVARRFSSWRIGLLGTLLLVLSPRLSADNFYNSKDAVFLAFFTAAVATVVPFIERPTGRRALACAAACALAIDVRLMGVLVPAATLALVGWRALGGQYRGQTRLPLLLGAYLVGLAGLVVLGWPFLWEAPLGNFIIAWRNMSHFRTVGELLYQGHLVRADQLPWHYALVWISLTVPLVYLLFFGVGALGIAGTLVRFRVLHARAAAWQDLLFLGLALAPLAAVITLHSVLYNGWRQLYFLYPMLLLVALRGLVAAWRWQPAPALGRRYWQPALALGVAASLAVVAGRMVRLHPLENLYFNALAPPPFDDHYETDYWSMGMRSGLEWVLAHDSRSQIKVASPELYPVELGWQLLPAAEHQRLVLVNDSAQADYFLHSRAYAHFFSIPYTHPLHELWADNVHVLDVFKLHPAAGSRATLALPAAGRAGE